MSREDDVFALLVESNPIPDIDELDLVQVTGPTYLADLDVRGSRSGPQIWYPSSDQPNRAPRIARIAVVAVVVVVMAVAVWVFSDPLSDPVDEPTTTLPTRSVTLDVSIEMDVVDTDPEAEIIGVFTATGAAVDEGHLCPRGVYSQTDYGAGPGFETWTMRLDCDEPLSSIAISVRSVGEAVGPNEWRATNTWEVVDGSGEHEFTSGTGDGTTVCAGSVCADTYDGELVFDLAARDEAERQTPRLADSMTPPERSIHLPPSLPRSASSYPKDGPLPSSSTSGSDSNPITSRPVWSALGISH